MKNIPLFDAHCDTIYESQIKKQGILRNDGHIDLIRAGAYSPYAQFFAVWFPRDSVTQGSLFREFQSKYEAFCAQLAQNEQRIVQCRSAGEIRAAGKAGLAAAVLSVEGAEILECDLTRLKQAYDMGVRAVNITWNHANRLSGSIAEETTRGLGVSGRAFVKRMQELGMLVDVSHLSEPGFWDVMEMTEKPIMASHSNARKIWNHPRNLTDAQFRSIVENGGVAGLNLYAGFIGDKPTMEDAVAHIEHFLSLGGENHIALGADLDGCDELPAGVRGIEDMEMLCEALLRRNYGEALVHNIFYNNLMRVVEKVCGI